MEIPFNSDSYELILAKNKFDEKKIKKTLPKNLDKVYNFQFSILHFQINQDTRHT